MTDIEHTIWSKYKGKGVLVFGLHPGENPKLLNDFREQTGITYPLIKGPYGNFAWPPGTGYPYPRDVVVDKKGGVRSIKQSFSTEELLAEVVKLLAE